MEALEGEFLPIQLFLFSTEHCSIKNYALLVKVKRSDSPRLFRYRGQAA